MVSNAIDSAQGLTALGGANRHQERREKMFELLTFDHSDDDDQVFDHDRDLALHRPCPCGCDNRDSDMIGYLNAIKDGVGFTLRIFDEDDYLAMERSL